MTPIERMQSFIDERWTSCQPTHYPDVDQSPRVHPEITEWEAEYFLDSVAHDNPEPRLFEIDDDRHMRSDRRPPTKGGEPAVFNFFEWPGAFRLETVAHMSAMARLRERFRWPREHLIFESAPLVDGENNELLTVSSLDILMLDEPDPLPSATMDPTKTSCRVGVEVKKTSIYLDRLVSGMKSCRAGSPHTAEHKKCLAIEHLRPRLFLVVAAGEDWRLFRVEDADGRAVLGDQLPDLDPLYFDAEPLGL
jgi:hypothetical protein